MGFYPKHLKVKRFRWNMRIIATAALSGCTFVREQDGWRAPRKDAAWYPLWSVLFPDGRTGRNFNAKSDAACYYLMCWFNKQGMWPKRRSALR